MVESIDVDDDAEVMIAQLRPKARQRSRCERCGRASGGR
jgi:ribosomal protein S14